MSKRVVESDWAVDNSQSPNIDFNRRKSATVAIKKKKSEPIQQYLERYIKYLDTLPLSNTPSPRCNGTLTLINDNELFLFGGEYYDEKEVMIFNDSYIYNIKSGEWSLVKSTNKPKPRCSHQTIMYNNALYIFGGEFASKNDYLHFNDMWKYNIGKDWELVKQKGTIPSPRSGHSMSIWKDSIVLFGGFYDTNNEVKYYNDLYVFNIPALTWKRVDSINTPPPPRSASVFSIHNGLLFIHGGYSKINDVGITHSDTWTVDLNRMELDGNKVFWEKRKLSGKIPNAQIGFGHTAKDDILYVFGGIKDINENLDSIFYNELFSINTNKTKSSILYPNGSSKLIEDLNIQKSEDTIPIERSKSLMAVKDDEIYIYGGIRELKRSDLILSDLWLFKKNTWKCLISCESTLESEEDSEDEDTDEEDGDADADSSNGGETSEEESE